MPSWLKRRFRAVTPASAAHKISRRAIFCAAISCTSMAFAADVAAPDAPRPVPEDTSIACRLDDPFAHGATAEALPWPSVWLGHFSGGHPYTDGSGRTLVDWRDEKVCFPTRELCETWIADRRATFSDPEGNWTCLFLR